MKKNLRALFSPLLSRLESGEGPYQYRDSHRTILMVVGGLFCFLALFTLVMLLFTGMTFFLPVVVFAVVGLLCLVVGWLGNDRAVAKVWGSRQ